MGLELDEYIYGKFVKYFKKETQLPDAAKAVFLNDLKSQLTIIARAVTGNPIEIFPAEREGGYKNNNFFLPVFFAELGTRENNKTFYYFRVLYLGIQQRLNLNWNAKEEYALEESQAKALESSRSVLAELFKEFPSAENIYLIAKEHFLKKDHEGAGADLSWIYGKWMNNDVDHSAHKLLNTVADIKVSVAGQAASILRAAAIEEVKVLEVDKKQQEDYVMTHNFEKVETADEFSGTWRDFDGEDELEDHRDALDELNMKYSVRVNDTAHSVYQADFIENTTVSESAEIDESGFHLKYDEWDNTKRSYKTGFCKLYPQTLLRSDVAYYRRTIEKNAVTLMGIRKMLSNVNNRIQQQKRLPQGNAFDIDAITDLFVDVSSKRTPSENIYVSNRKQEKDLSVLILLDISLSSDGYAANNRVIDVEKEVSIIFGEILSEFKIDFAIDSFYSKTRNHCSYITIKEFDENWNTARNKVGAIEPQGYTRIGTALRHAGARLDKRNSKSKWVILISDGKPNDYDKYEGNYGIGDVKQALRELNQRHINSYALAIEAQAKFYLPQMFGQDHYQILTTPGELLQALIKLYERIRHQ